MAENIIKVEGLNEMIDVFAQSPALASRQLNNAIKKSIFYIQGKAKRNAPVDVGFLRNSGFSTSFSTLKGTLRNKAPYAIFVHDGTAPHFPPIDAVTPWAERHGIPPFLVARSISFKGTKPNPFFERAINESSQSVKNNFTVALNNIKSALLK
jgi:HK97 gp10 family phage protein